MVFWVPKSNTHTQKKDDNDENQQNVRRGDTIGLPLDDNALDEQRIEDDMIEPDIENHVQKRSVTGIGGFLFGNSQRLKKKLKIHGEHCLSGKAEHIDKILL